MSNINFNINYDKNVNYKINTYKQLSLDKTL